MKVVIGLALVAVLAGLATNWARHRGEALLHHSFDTALPSELEAQPWVPLRHGKPRRADRVVFDGGNVRSPRCAGVLGSYTVRVTHSFSFTTSATPVRTGCGSRQVQRALGRATRVAVASRGQTQRLVFSDAEGHTVVELQAKTR